MVTSLVALTKLINAWPSYYLDRWPLTDGEPSW